ncbi:hypothetical protein [Sphingomonas sp. RS2018]
MIDEDSDHDDDLPFARSYDSFKHMAGISLLSLGGIFAFADSSGLRFARPQLVVVLGFVLLAAVTSIYMAGSLAALEVRPEPRETVARRIRIGSLMVGMSLSCGLGGFTFNFISALFK